MAERFGRARPQAEVGALAALPVEKETSPQTES